MPELKTCAPAGGIYVHVPFCLCKCPYCDFFSVTDRSLVPPFLDALGIEMRLTGELLPRSDSLYLGGGTPSLLDPAQVADIIAAANRFFTLAAAAEITLEVLVSLMKKFRSRVETEEIEYVHWNGLAGEERKRKNREFILIGQN